MIETGPQFTQALAAAGIVGMWHWQVADGGVILDHGSAEVLAGRADLAGEVLSLERSFACLHSADRDRVFASIDEHERRGGLIAIEYRVRSPEGRERWLLDRGELIEGPGGTRLGYGLLIDITRTKQAPERDAPESGETTLEAAAEQCRAARAIVEQRGTRVMRILMDMLLIEFRRALVDK